MDNHIFELTVEESEKIQQWKDTLPPPITDLFGEDYCYEYVFYPTGLGIIKRIRRMDGYEFDITDYSTF
jgi:hypothetical protein